MKVPNFWYKSVIQIEFQYIIGKVLKYKYQKWAQSGITSYKLWQQKKARN